MKLELWMPLKNPTLTQSFGANANPSYSKDGLIGHPGYDFVTYYDDKVLLAEDGYIYKIINKDNPDFSKFRAVFQLVALDNDYVLEICYGHANKILVTNGFYECGDPCITEGNTGGVWSGGKEVSVEERQKGSKAGTHLHIQGRICKKVKQLSDNPKDMYLSSQDNASIPYKDKDGYWYYVVNYYNGYNGCVPIKWSAYAGDSIIYRKIIKLLKDFIKNI